MTINTYPVREEYEANAGQTIFNFTFKIYADTDLNVYITAAGSAADDDNDITTNYVIDPGSIGTENGGFLTLNVGANAGDLITIISDIPENRIIDYQNNGDFNPLVVNSDFDRAVSLIKQLSDKVGRGLSFDDSAQGVTELSLPEPLAEYMLRWKADLTGLENISISQLPPNVITQDLTLTFGTVAAMVADVSLIAGQLVRTKGYYSDGDGGGATYLITAPQAADESTDHTLANGNVALLQDLVTGLSQSDITTALDGLATNKASTGDGSAYTTTTQSQIKRYIELNGSTIETDGNTIGFDVESGAQISGADITSHGGVALNYAPDAAGVILNNSRVASDSPTNGHAVNMNALGIVDAVVSDNILNAAGFAILTNEAGSVDGLAVSGNIITFGADGVEINNPADRVHDNMTVTGNVFKCTTDGPTSASGFAVGIAAGKNIAVVGNSATGTSGEAYHVEDAQNTLTFVGNTATECQEQGFFALQQNGGTLGEGLPLVGNSFRAEAGNSVEGVLLAFTPDGSLEGMTVSSNRVVGFGTGFTTGRTITMATGNVAEDCGVGMVAFGDVHGVQLLRNCPVKLTPSSGALVGGYATDDVTTSLVDTSNLIASELGATVRELHFKAPSVAAAGGANIEVDLFDLPTFMNSRVIVRMVNSNGTSFLYASLDSTWDGTTLTQENNFFDNGGLVGGTVTFSENAGAFHLSVFIASPITLEINVSIIGEHYTAV